MYQGENCVNCHQPFTTFNSARIIPTCGHNICTSCLKTAFSQQIKELKCGNCESTTAIESDEIQNFPKDIAVLKSVRECSMSIHNTSKRLSEDTQIFSNEMLLNDSRILKAASMCSNHGKTLEIICIVDKELLCPICAIFGQHRDHNLKTIDQFCREVDEKRTLMKRIESRKAATDEAIKNQFYRRTVTQQLRRKKNHLTLTIKQKFATLQNLISEEQSNILTSLNKTFDRIESQIKRLTNEEAQIDQQFRYWKEKVCNYFTNIDKQKEIIDKVSIFYDSRTSNLSEGEAYVEEIQQKNKTIKQSIDTMIKGVSLEFSQSLSNSISNYARIIENPINLTAKNITITPDKNPEEEEIKKRPVRVEFVKSNLFQQDSYILDKKQRSKPKDQKNAFYSPNTKVRPTSVNEKLQSRFASPNPKGVPAKSHKKIQQGKNKANDVLATILNDFKKSTDTLDFTSYELADEEIIQVVEAAAEIKKIKGLKLSKNKLTNEGLKAIIPSISFSTNLNLSHNLLTEEGLDEIIKKRTKMPQLRIINLSANKLNERKVKSKLEELKRVGIIVTL